MAAVAVLLAVAPADAHPGHSRSSRLIKLDLAADPPRIGYGLVFEPTASDAARKLADTDQSGTISVEESRNELERLGAELRSKLTVCVGSTFEAAHCAPVAPADVLEAVAGGFTEPAGKTLAISWEFRVDLAAEDRVVRVEDAWTRPEVDRTDALIEPPANVRLASAGPGTNGPPDRVTREFKWADDRAEEPRRLFVVWDLASSTPSWLLIGLGAAGLAMLVQLFLGSSRRRTSALT